MNNPPRPIKAGPTEQPERVPLFGTWRRAYVIVLAVLALDIVLLYACTRLLS